MLKEDARLHARTKLKRQSLVLRKFIQENINLLLNEGFIWKFISPVASRLVVVRSGGRDWRLCIDLQSINEIPMF